MRVVRYSGPLEVTSDHSIGECGDPACGEAIRMEHVPFALGIDVGTTNTKVALTEVGGTDLTVRAVASAPTPPPDRLGEVLLGLIDQVLGDRPPPAAIGIASMAETGVPLAADDAPLGDWLRWDGHRAGAEAEELAARLGWAELVRATGTRPSAKVPLATWLWLRRHEPERFPAPPPGAGPPPLPRP